MVSILFLRLIPALPPEPMGMGRRTGIFRSTWVGVVEGLRNRVVRAVFVGLLVGVGVAAMDNVALVFLAKQRGAGDFGYGLLVSGFGVGMIVASLTLVRMGRRLRPVRLLLLGWTLTGAGLLVTAASPLLGAMLVGQAFAGAGNGSSNIADNTLVQQHVPRSLLGRAFGLTRTGAFLGQAMAAILAGWLLELTSPATVFLIAGCGTLMIVALLWAMLRGSLTGPANEQRPSVRRPPATAGS
jgi:MFS family permease